MQDKGYDHPLYSLDLLPAAAAPDGGAEFSVPVPQGQLVTSAALRRRAAKHSTALCLGAVQVALAHHRRAAFAFAVHGLTPRWAAAVAHWAGELRARERQREPTLARIAALLRAQHGDLAAGRVLWRRLALIVELGGMAGPAGPVSGRPPRAELAFADALGRCGAQLAAPEVAARLAPFGLSPALLAEVRDTAAGLWSRRQLIAEAEASRVRLSGAIAVIRGAICGDLARLSRVAAVVLLPAERAALGIERIFLASSS